MENQKGNKSVIISLIIVVIIIAGLVYAMSHKKEGTDQANIEITQTKNTTNQNVETKTNNQTSKPMENNTRTLANFTPVTHVAELQKTDLVAGTGAEVKEGATVSVHYTGAVASTGAVFQSSKDFGPNPVTFPLGGVIKGWTNGIPGMKIGGTRRLLIPAAEAYGATPPPGSGIPVNADLVFDVELVAIQ